ncbi:MAG: GNAT family N-acetyltransferase, partial [Candidatus Thermoplasmatota archaeon]|nr:GNAT family N-acetyltransferase [Candidatus Thermoplasmatota archaeon]
QWAMYHVFRRRRHEETYPEDPLRDDESAEKLMKRRDPEWEALYFGAVDRAASDRLMGWLEIELARESALTYETNSHMAWVDLAVLTPHRRQGVGLALLAKAAQVARGRDRSLLISGTDEEDGRRFIETLGAQVALTWRENRLVLGQVDWEMVEEWVTEGPSRSPNTTLRFFESYLDDNLIEEFCEMANEVSNQEPRGDLNLGDEFFTPEIFRERVDSFVEAGGAIRRAITVEADGRISGYTVMGYHPSEATLIRQYGTGVREIYRGRGLGKWVKAAMLLRVREELPKVKVVITGNATINAPMLSINDRLGFKPYKDGIEVQMPLEEVDDFLAKRSSQGDRGSP